MYARYKKLNPINIRDTADTPALKTQLVEDDNATTLDLSKHTINDECMKKILKGLEPDSTIKKMNLRYTTIDEEAIGYLFRKLAYNTTLEHINLSAILLSEKSLEQLTDTLNKNESLTYLDLSANDFNEKMTSMLEDCLSNNYSLLELRGVSSQKIKNYLERNNKINDILNVTLNSMQKNVLIHHYRELIELIHGYRQSTSILSDLPLELLDLTIEKGYGMNSKDTARLRKKIMFMLENIRSQTENQNANASSLSHNPFSLFDKSKLESYLNTKPCLRKSGAPPSL